MKNRYLIHKILVVIIILLPVFSWSGCKKQARCGCGKDVISTIDSMLIDHAKIVYGSNGSTAYFTITNAYGYYDSYYFCNPIEMYSNYSKVSSGDMLISGKLYWECQYLMNSSNSYYYQYMKVYNIEVTQLESWLYGKK